MTRIDITKRGRESFSQLTSLRLQNKLEHQLRLIQEVPTLGSRLVRDSLKEQFGENCLKMDLAPFALIYEYDEQAGIVHVYGIVHLHSIA